MRFLSPTPIALLLCSSMSVMAGAIIAPSLPEMQAALARTPSDALLVRLVLTLPSLFTALSSPLAGWAVDRWGRRIVLLGGIAVYLVAGTSGLVVATLPQLLVGRALLGVSIACITTASITLIADLFADHDRERFLGVQSGFMGMTAMLFLSLGGFLAEQHWRAPFAIYFLGIFVGWFALRHLPVNPVVEQSRQTAGPVHVDVPSLRIAVIYVCGFLGMMLFYLIPVQLPYFLQSITHGAASRAGFAIGCATLVGAMTSLQYRRVREILGFRSIFFVMFAIVGLSFVLLARSGDYRTILATLALGGLGWGLLVPNATVWLSSIAPIALRGRLVGGLMTCLFIGQFVSPIVAQPVLTRVGLGGAFGVYSCAGYGSLGIALGFLVGGPIWKRLHRD